MPKKSLTEEQKKFIADNKQTSAQDLAKNMYGIGAKTVEKYLQSLTAEPKNSKQAVEESITTIKTDPSVHKGVAVMTSEKSLMVDEIAKQGKVDLTGTATKIYQDKPAPDGVVIND